MPIDKKYLKWFDDYYPIIPDESSWMDNSVKLSQSKKQKYKDRYYSEIVPRFIKYPILVFNNKVYDYYDIYDKNHKIRSSLHLPGNTKIVTEADTSPLPDQIRMEFKEDLEKIQKKYLSNVQPSSNSSILSKEFEEKSAALQKRAQQQRDRNLEQEAEDRLNQAAIDQALEENERNQIAQEQRIANMIEDQWQPVPEEMQQQQPREMIEVDVNVIKQMISLDNAYNLSSQLAAHSEYVNRIDHDNKTLLHHLILLASNAQNSDTFIEFQVILSTLHKYKIDFTIKDNDGKTAFELAKTLTWKNDVLKNSLINTLFTGQSAQERKNRFNSDASQSSPYKILILGDRNAGKTSVFCQLFGEKKPDETSEYNSEYNIDFKVGTIGHDNDALTIEALELGRRYSGLDDYFRSASTGHGILRGLKAAVLVFNMTDSSTFSGIRKHYGEVRNRYPDTLPILLVGTHNDSHSKTVTNEEIQRLTASLGISPKNVFCVNANNPNDKENIALDNLANRLQIVLPPPAPVFTSSPNPPQKNTSFFGRLFGNKDDSTSSKGNSSNNNNKNNSP